MVIPTVAGVTTRFGMEGSHPVYILVKHWLQRLGHIGRMPDQ